MLRGHHSTQSYTNPTSGPRQVARRSRADRQRSSPTNRPPVEPHAQALRLLATAAHVVEHPQRIDAGQLAAAYQRYRTIVESSPQRNASPPIRREFVDLTSLDSPPSTVRAPIYHEVIDLTLPIVPLASARAARPESSETPNSPGAIEVAMLPSSQARSIRRTSEWYPVC